MQTSDPCVHHWFIYEAKGPYSRGECRKCHEVREFSNIPPLWDKQYRDVITREITGRKERELASSIA